MVCDIPKRERESKQEKGGYVTMIKLAVVSREVNVYEGERKPTESRQML
jgi:hypothetical protein